MKCHDTSLKGCPCYPHRRTYKRWEKKAKYASIQYNQLDLWWWPRNQAIHTYETVNMGKKRHSLLINDWRDYKIHALVLRVPSNGSLPLKTQELFWQSLGMQHNSSSFSPWGMSQYLKASEDRYGWGSHGWGGDNIQEWRILSSS